MSKVLSLVLLLAGLFFTLFGDYSYRQNNGGRILTDIIRPFFKPFAENSTEPMLVPIPFYQNNQTVTFILIGVAMFFIAIASLIEIKRFKTIGHNKQSAGVVSLATCLAIFNLVLTSWNL
ncbi:hypothetical protein ISG33_14500 [Glaciecola sp. MH2013]|uniref:hypothetical protein n=1 Tax=Glaciecola sp. MH2013 TaxID=2785524 RepID=UPI00189F638F|nr:hypothetical protein [Glaciecola sp. MH2013]MBF7074613.1 hypothetical protein [Glaciecola sp. MH2013]